MAQLIAELDRTRVKIPLRTPGADEFSYLSEAEKEEALRAERELEEHKKQMQESLAAATAYAETVRSEGKFKDPILAQEQLLQEGEQVQKTSAEQERELQWCSSNLNKRLDPSRINEVSIVGRAKKHSTDIVLTIVREDTSVTSDTPRNLHRYGFYEWLEMREAIQKSKSRYREIVEKELNRLLNRISQIIEIPPLPKKSSVQKKKKSAIEEGPSTQNEHETRFGLKDLFSNFEPPDLSMLNLTLPPNGPYTQSYVHVRPEHGIIFLDHEGKTKFQRVSELPLCPDDHLNYLRTWLPSDIHGAIIEERIIRELKRRQDLRGQE